MIWCFFEVCSVADVRDPSMVAILELEDLGSIGGPWISDGFCLGRLVLDECLMIEHALTVMGFFLI